MKLLISPFYQPEFNLAAEEFLFSSCTEDIVFLYVNSPCVVLGSNQVLRNELNQAYCLQNMIPVLRRMSGGGTVYHDKGNLNYSFLSLRVDKELDMSGRFLQPVLEVLNRMDIPATMGARKDLWLNGKFKISGTAAHISKHCQLHHGTLLFNSDTEALRQVLLPDNPDSNLHGTASVPSPVMNILDFLKQNENQKIFTFDQFFELFADNLSVLFNVRKEVLETNEEIETLISTKYATEKWNRKK